MAQTYSDTDHESPEGEHADRPHAPEIKPPGPFRKMRYSLFSPETRTGRFLRGLGRILLIVIGLVGLGMLVTYLVFYRPLEQQFNQTRLTAEQVQQDLQSAQKDRDLAVEQQQAAEKRAEDAQNQLSVELTRVQLLRAMTSLKNAQLAIQENNKTAAVNAMTAAESSFKLAFSRLENTNPEESEILQARFSLARKQLDSDPARALPDIELLITDISRIDNTLK